MSAPYESGNETARSERAIVGLSARTGRPLVEIRELYAREFARLQRRAKVRTYLSVLTTANIRTLLAAKRAGSRARKI